MHPDIQFLSALPAKTNIVYLVSSTDDIPSKNFSQAERKHILVKNKKNKTDFFLFDRLEYLQMVQIAPEEKTTAAMKEQWRKRGNVLCGLMNERGETEITVAGLINDTSSTLAFVEGIVLSNYQFLKYKTTKEKRNSLAQISVVSGHVGKKEVELLRGLTRMVFSCRDLINEPNSFLTTAVFMEEIEKLGKESGTSVEILNKSKIEALKMGGLLGVNKGSKEPPAFAILEWKPAGSKNRKPYVFVGKGIVFDSGGMNLKPGDSMNNMKDDMSGAAAVAAVVCAIAKAKLPVHVIGLIPATDNRPGPGAIVSGDILTMHNGTTVEVINTDAEGRLILADALSYAKRYDPMLVIDLATLTGAAVRAIGKYGIAAMQSGAETEFEALKHAGMETNERLVEFPLWEDYVEGLKSDLADLKNLGPPEAGMITAGKFLEKFTAYPFIHLDIAGPAFIEKPDSYRGSGGTGVGVRLLFEFIRKRIAG